VLRFEWNALRIGGHVLVHDPRTAEMTLTNGTVATVVTNRGGNGVGIRVGGNSGETSILWPSRLAVHRQPRDPTEACWRCEELAERTVPSPDVPAMTGRVGADDATRPGPAISLGDPI
jgi:hypothetical protein